MPEYYGIGSFASDPIIFDDWGGGWSFFDETWNLVNQVWKTKEEAIQALRNYCEQMG